MVTPNQLQGLHNSSCNSRWGGRRRLSDCTPAALCETPQSKPQFFLELCEAGAEPRCAHLLRPSLAAVPATACGGGSCKLSQVDGSFHFELLGGAFAGSILKLAAVDVRDEAVDLHCKHAVPLWDH